jgi:phage terminase large subunit GpA-like protein
MTMANTKPGPEVRRTIYEAGEQRRGGMPCPECGQQIDISLDDLLIRRSFTCRTAGCGTILHLDQRRSSEAIENLRTLKGRLRDIGQG